MIGGDDDGDSNKSGRGQSANDPVVLCDGTQDEPDVPQARPRITNAVEAALSDRSKAVLQQFREMQSGNFPGGPNFNAHEYYGAYDD